MYDFRLSLLDHVQKVMQPKLYGIFHQHFGSDVTLHKINACSVFALRVSVLAARVRVAPRSHNQLNAKDVDVTVTTEVLVKSRIDRNSPSFSRFPK